MRGWSICPVFDISAEAGGVKLSSVVGCVMAGVVAACRGCSALRTCLRTFMACQAPHTTSMPTIIQSRASRDLGVEPDLKRIAMPSLYTHYAPFIQRCRGIFNTKPGKSVKLSTPVKNRHSNLAGNPGRSMGGVFARVARRHMQAPGKRNCKLKD